MEYTSNVANAIYHPGDIHHSEINISDAVNQHNAVLHL